MPLGQSQLEDDYHSQLYPEVSSGGPNVPPAPQTQHQKQRVQAQTHAPAPITRGADVKARPISSTRNKIERFRGVHDTL